VAMTPSSGGLVWSRIELISSGVMAVLPGLG
jgi:hypothetical protein